MYGSDDILAPVRSNAERMTDPSGLSRLAGPSGSGRAFSRDEVRERVIPVYMGLVKQIDDQMGVLFSYLERAGRMADTMIVFTSDHGDNLGDHWLGEKDSSTTARPACP